MFVCFPKRLPAFLWINKQEWMHAGTFRTAGMEKANHTKCRKDIE